MPNQHPHAELAYTAAERAKLHAAWSSAHTPASVLVVLLVDAYGTEALEWAPETVRLELHDDFGVNVPWSVLSRLMAGIRLVTTDEFYKDLTAFNDLCVILAGHHYQPGVFTPPDAAEVAWSVSEALLLSPPEPDDEQPFDPAITAYMGEILKDEGILQPPDVLRIAAHDPGLAERVRYDFADDPDMFTAVWTAERQKTDAINAFVRGRLVAMLQTLEALPLRHGRADGLARKLLAQLPSSPPSGG